MYPTAEETAVVLAAMLKRSGQSRARVSSKTIRKVSRRTTLRSAFIVELSEAMANSYDWLFVEIGSGGFGAVQAKALEAAKSVTGSKYLTADERSAIDNNFVDYDMYHAEVADDEDIDEDD